MFSGGMGNATAGKRSTTSVEMSLTPEATMKRARFVFDPAGSSYSYPRQRFAISTQNGNIPSPYGDKGYRQMRQAGVSLTSSSSGLLNGLTVEEAGMYDGSVANVEAANTKATLTIRISSDNMGVNKNQLVNQIMCVPRQEQTGNTWTREMAREFRLQLKRDDGVRQYFNNDRTIFDIESHHGQIYNAVTVQMFNYVMADTVSKQLAGRQDDDRAPVPSLLKTPADVWKFWGLVAPVVSEDGNISGATTASSSATRSYAPTERLIALGVGGINWVANYWGTVSPGDRLFFCLRKLTTAEERSRFGFDSEQPFNLNARDGGRLYVPQNAGVAGRNVDQNYVADADGTMYSRSPFFLVPVVISTFPTERYIEDYLKYQDSPDGPKKMGLLISVGRVIEKPTMSIYRSSTEFNKGVFSLQKALGFCSSMPLRIHSQPARSSNIFYSIIPNGAGVPAAE